METGGHVWRVRSAALVRQLLRERRRTTQAGFTAESIPKGYLKHHPILISDGPLHDEQRTKVGRFFAPKVVASRFTGLMEECADRLLAGPVGRTVVLDELALLYTVEVTASTVGLTDSPVPKMARRLESFFDQPPFDLTRSDLGRSNRDWIRAVRTGLVPIVRFHLADVRPAIRARRRQPRQDVISHLIAEGYTDADILVECVTYGTAGMVTTREFIAMAAWHLLSDPELRATYLAAEQPARLALLNEIIRLEPVVGHLYRRVQEELTFDHDGTTHTADPGDLLDLDVRAANADPATVGECPFDLRPERPLQPGVNEAVLSFGDGAHRCPGQPLAILESDVLLHRLLGREVVVLGEPTIEWVDLIAGYALRGFRLRVS
jgi:cytochrome P450